MDLKEEGLISDGGATHWYFISKGAAVRKFLREIKTVDLLDVGAGSGIFSRQLLDAGICETATCVDPNYTQEKTLMHNGRQMRFVKSPQKDSHNLMLMMDVLEHVEDDLGLLREYTKHLQSGGYVFITVPAFELLWSDHDEFLQHHRRYTIDMVEDVVRRAGLTPVRSCYFFTTLFPAVAIQRLLQKLFTSAIGGQPRSELKRHPAWLNRLLIDLHRLECRSVFALNRLFGLTVFCLCRKE